MVVTENKAYTLDYLDPRKRSIANAIQIHFKDGTSLENVEVEYPLGHRFRREEAVPKILNKYTANLATHYTEKQRKNIEETSLNYEKLVLMNVNDFVELYI